MKIHIGQINTITGDLNGNVEKIVHEIKEAQINKCDVVVFPETCISGYCCGALYDRPDFIRNQMDKLYEEILPLTKNGLIVILGMVWMDYIKNDDFPYLTNSAIVLQHGKIINRYNKVRAANHDHHEDNKYFNFENYKNGVCEVNINNEKVKIGTLICQDVWVDDCFGDSLVKNIKRDGAEILFVINQSYFSYGKNDERISRIKEQSKKYQIPIVYVNNVGVGDIVKNIITYDGSSFIVDGFGNLMVCCRRFEVHSFSYNFIYSKEKSIFSEHVKLSDNKYTEILQSLIYTTKELFSVLGLEKVQVHLSGGIDSALVAYIVTKAMGKDNVIFITNPSNENKLGRYIEKLINNLESKVYIQDIQKSYDEIKKSIQISLLPEIGTNDNLKNLDKNKLIDSTIHAVVRTVFGLADCHLFKTGIVATGNHTEIVEGWTNFHDIGSVGVMSLIGDLTKVEVFKLSEYINIKEKREIIPYELYNGTILPAAELVDTDIDPFDYFITSGIDAELIRHRKTINILVEEFKQMTLDPELFPRDWNNKSIYEKITINEFEKLCKKSVKNSKISVFKAAQSAPIVIVSPRSRGFSNRETLINKYTE